MSVKKIYFLTFGLFLLKLGYAFFNYKYYGLDFGKLIIGHDELAWQDSTIFFYEHGVGLDAIKLSFSQENAFESGGWPYLVGILHNLFGLSYFNAIWVRMILFFFAVNCLYKLLIDSGHGKKRTIVCVLFLTLYHPFVAADATYLRDDIIVYLIIILLRLSAVKGFLNGLVAIPAFLFFTYILLLTRPFAVLVFVSLYLFYFRLMRPIHLLFIIPPFLFIGSSGTNLFEYSYNFIITFKPDIKSIFFLSFKYYFGPTPWNMLRLGGEYNPLWYAFTLMGTVACLFLKRFYHEVASNWKVLIALFVTGFLPYVISHQNVDAVGPRQFAMVGPFLFIILYSRIITSLSFKQEEDHSFFEKRAGVSF